MRISSGNAVRTHLNLLLTYLLGLDEVSRRNTVLQGLWQHSRWSVTAVVNNWALDFSHVQQRQHTQLVAMLNTATTAYSASSWKRFHWTNRSSLSTARVSLCTCYPWSQSRCQAKEIVTAKQLIISCWFSFFHRPFRPGGCRGGAESVGLGEVRTKCGMSAFMAVNSSSDPRQVLEAGWICFWHCVSFQPDRCGSQNTNIRTRARTHARTHVHTHTHTRHKRTHALMHWHASGGRGPWETGMKSLCLLFS